MGRKPGSEADALNKAFLATVRAATGVIRFGLPFTRWRAGLKGRRVLEAFFRRELPAKRASQIDDLFTRLCHARTEDGEQLSDDDISTHLIFVLMAAHDTRTITHTNKVYNLANPPHRPHPPPTQNPQT